MVATSSGSSLGSQNADYSVQLINSLENKQLMVDLIYKRQHVITLQSAKTNRTHQTTGNLGSVLLSSVPLDHNSKMAILRGGNLNANS